MSEDVAMPRSSNETNSFAVLVRYWPLIVALVMCAGILGESRFRLSSLESKLVQNEQRNEARFHGVSEELKEHNAKRAKLNHELVMGLGRVQLSLARICAKLDVACE